MNRNVLLGLVALAGVAAGAALMDLASTAAAAPGDFTISAPRTNDAFQLEEVCLNRAPYAAVRFRDAEGKVREVIVRNGTTTGYDFATDAPFSVTTASGFALFRTALGVSNPTVTAASAWLKTNGVVTGTGNAQ